MKNVILLISAFFSYLAYAIFIDKTIDICDIYCDSTLNYNQRIFIFFPFLLFFSLITYKIPNIISRTWIKYSIFAIPIVIFISTYINLGLHHNPNGSWQDIFDYQALWLLYILFSIGSLISMYKGWRKYKELSK